MYVAFVGVELTFALFTLKLSKYASWKVSVPMATNPLLEGIVLTGMLRTCFPARDVVTWLP